MERQVLRTLLAPIFYRPSALRLSQTSLIRRIRSRSTAIAMC